jgi:hypothetical protein
MDIVRYCCRTGSGEEVAQVWNTTQGTEVSVVALGNKDSDSTLDDTLNLPFTTFVPAVAPAAGASDEDRMEFLHRQLDSLKDQRLLDRFVLDGPQARRQGGAMPPLPGLGGGSMTRQCSYLALSWCCYALKTPPPSRTFDCIAIGHFPVLLSAQSPRNGGLSFRILLRIVFNLLPVTTNFAC